MTAACITLDQIESRAATSAVLASYVRRVPDRIIAATVGRAILKFLNTRLEQLKEPLRKGSLDELSSEELVEVATLLKALNISLLRMGEDQALRSHRSLKVELEKVCESVEDFESILENIYLALDPGFHGTVATAIEKLDLGVERRATLSR